MTKGKLKVHSENILPIIKKWLYSDRDIFVRELVSNSMDAMQKLKMLRDKGEIDFADESLKIDITTDSEAKTLTFSDTGIGMTADEVERYIAQVAFSSAEEFIEKYQSADEQEQIIGHFGLGFYSSYMVADTVEIQTLSYKPEPAVHWSCDGSTDYDLDTGSRLERGTDIIMHVTETEKEFLEPTRLREILQRYCAFLPYPIYLNGDQINKQEPLWMRAPSECEEKDYLEFYRHLYPMDADPLFWIHLNVDYPFHLKGILYFPKVRRQPEGAPAHGIHLYCNRVFVSDECKDLIPDFLLGLRGVIDSPDIPLNVSRSHLQMDRTVRQVAGHISKKVADRLKTLFKTSKEQYLEAWDDIQSIVKLGILQDEKFYEKVKEILVWKSTNGEWTTIEEYLERNEPKIGDKVYYTSDESEEGQFLKIYNEKGIEVVVANAYIDSFVMSFLEKHLSGKTFQRIDADIDDAIVDKEREQTVLDGEGRTAASYLADFVRQSLGNDAVEVEAKSLASDHLPGFIMMEEQQRRMRDYMLSVDPSKKLKDLAGFNKHTFVVNTNSPLVQTLQKISGRKPDLAKAAVNHIYELSLLAQRELDPDQLNGFVARSNEVLEKMAAEIATA